MTNFKAQGILKRLARQARPVLGLLVLLVLTAISSYPLWDGDSSLMDFGSFYASGLKAETGGNPYDPASEYIFEINFPDVGAGGIMMNLNPPISVVIFRLITPFDPHRTLFAWQVTSAFLYTLSIFVLAQTYRQNMNLIKIAWAVSLAGFWHTLTLGQVYVLLLFFVVIGWVSLKKEKYVLAGLAIGLAISVKPNFALWAIFLLASGYSLTFLVSTLTSILVGLIPIALFGTGVYAQWLEASALLPETLIMPGNNSILGLTTRFADVAIGIAASVLFVIALLVLVRKAKVGKGVVPMESICAIGIIASLLASPISWTGYTILLLPIFYSLRKWATPALAGAALLTVPFGFVLHYFQSSFINFIVIGWLYGWAGVLVLYEVVTNTMMTRSIQTN